MNCLFCTGKAVVLPTSGYDGDVIACDKDGIVKIGPGTRSLLEDMTLAGRRSVLAKARGKVAIGGTPEILSSEM